MPLKSPCADQTAEEIEAYYCNAEVGSRAAVRDTRWNLLQYTILPITGIDPLRGTAHVAYGALNRKDGKKHTDYTGKVSLVVPTYTVIAWAREHPQGERGYSIFIEERESLFGR